MNVKEVIVCPGCGNQDQTLILPETKFIGRDSIYHRERYSWDGKTWKCNLCFKVWTER